MFSLQHFNGLDKIKIKKQLVAQECGWKFSKMTKCIIKFPCSAGTCSSFYDLELCSLKSAFLSCFSAYQGVSSVVPVFAHQAWQSVAVQHVLFPAEGDSATRGKPRTDTEKWLTRLTLFITSHRDWKQLTERPLLFKRHYYRNWLVKLLDPLQIKQWEG